MKGLPEIVSLLGSRSKARSGVIRFSRDGREVTLPIPFGNSLEDHDQELGTRPER